jgi:hypothetical protein
MASPEFILTRDLIASVETYIGWALKSEALPYTAGLVDIGDDGILETFLLFNRNLGSRSLLTKEPGSRSTWSL